MFNMKQKIQVKQLYIIILSPSDPPCLGDKRLQWMARALFWGFQCLFGLEYNERGKFAY